MKKNRSKAAHHAFLQRVDAEYREKLARKAEKRKVKNEKKIEAKMDVDAVIKSWKLIKMKIFVISLEYVFALLS